MQAQSFRDNLFQMDTRRLGTVAEIIIQRLIDGMGFKTIHHDMLSDKTRVGFSCVEKAHKRAITASNVLDIVENEGLSVRLFPLSEWPQQKFDCNIQQIKRMSLTFLQSHKGH